jgi:Tol biopolymer transport system component
MTPERFSEIEKLYHAALEHPGGRAALLAKADPELRRAVESLLGRPDALASLQQSIFGQTETVAPAPQLEPGAKLGPYTIESKLGAGGMGEVFRAKDTRLGRAVAIKTCDARFGERFQREARAISALNHPNICTLHDVGPNYIVMELVEGDTLATRLKKGQLTFDDTLKYGMQIADALAAAHAKGIAHRDLKPGNIMLSKAGVKVLDFGLAKSDQEETMTGTKVIMGTPAYMAPEQLEGRDAGAQTDLFAFGLILYEMATGKRPPIGVIPAADGLPEKLHHCLERCLQNDPDDRWQSARDLRAELAWIAEAPHEGAVVPVASSGPKLLPWVTAAVLAITSLIGFWMAWRSSDKQADHPLLRLSVDLGPEAATGQATIRAAISPDGSRLVFPVRGQDGITRLATRLLNEGQITLLAGTEEAKEPFFKPDGEWIGFFAQGKLKKISLRGGAAFILCDATEGRGGTWGEDDTIIATLNDQPATGLSSVPAAGGAPKLLTNPGERGEATHRWPQILPGGQAVLFMGSKTASNYDDSDIEVLSLKTGQVKTVQPSGYFAHYLATSNGNGYLVYVHLGTLYGVRFDLDRLEVRGAPVTLLDDVAGNSDIGSGQFDFSRNGTFVYSSGKRGFGTLDWLDNAGKTEPLLTRTGRYYRPQLSSDGKRLVNSNNSDIEVFDLEHKTIAQLTFEAKTRTNIRPIWAPDGKHVVFESQGAATFSLEWVRADGSGEAQPLLEGKGELWPRSFSPDGKHLAFAQRNAETGFDLWTLPLDLTDPEHPRHGNPEMFLRTPLMEASPRFSPDGRWIAYESDETGRSEIFVKRFPARGPSDSGRRLISSDGGRDAYWSANGKQLFYLGGDNHIMTASVSADGDSFATSKPIVWSSTQTASIYGISPEGNRFVVPALDDVGSAKGSVHVTFLLNFFDEVRRRIPD